MSVPFKIRRNTAAGAEVNNAVLADGEPGYDKTNKVLKIGDGSTAWNDLDPVGSGTYVPASSVILRASELQRVSTSDTNVNNYPVAQFGAASASRVSLVVFGNDPRMTGWTEFDLDVVISGGGADTDPFTVRVETHTVDENGFVASGGLTNLGDISVSPGSGANQKKTVSLVSGVAMPAATGMRLLRLTRVAPDSNSDAMNLYEVVLGKA